MDCYVSDATGEDTVDFDTFVERIEMVENDGKIVFDGEGLTVELKPETGCYQSSLTHVCTASNAPATHNTPNRVNSDNAQFQIFNGCSIDISISNVKFIFVPSDFTICANSGWKGTFEADKTFNAEIQLLTSGDVIFTNCSFVKTLVSPYSSTGECVIEGCSFSNIYNSYAMKDIHSPTIVIKDNTFANTGGGIMIGDGATPRSDYRSISVEGNEFMNVDMNSKADKIGTRGLIQFASGGDHTQVSYQIAGNTSYNTGEYADEPVASVFRSLNTTSSISTDAEQIMSIQASNSFSGDIYTRNSTSTTIPEVPPSVTVTQSTGGFVAYTTEHMEGSVTKITLTATPDSNYEFSHWVVNGVYGSSDPTLVLSLYADVAVSAVFTYVPPAVVIPSDDDEDDVPYFPPIVVTDSKDDDDKTTIVACAAAAVAAAMMAALLLMDGRKR